MGVVPTDQSPVRLPGRKAASGRTASRLKQWHWTDCSHRTQPLQLFVYEPFGSAVAILAYGAAAQLAAPAGGIARGAASSSAASSSPAPTPVERRA